jgi:hypothetical protein
MVTEFIIKKMIRVKLPLMSWKCWNINQFHITSIFLWLLFMMQLYCSSKRGSKHILKLYIAALLLIQIWTKVFTVFTSCLHNLIFMKQSLLDINFCHSTRGKREQGEKMTPIKINRNTRCFLTWCLSTETLL